jgi:N-acetylglucosaminyl-diphospho-decaprenol L-rhamnosyltransferase
MISLVLVNYRTSSLAIEAIRSARANTTAPLQIVVVDNSLDPREADALRAHADILIAADSNRGYAGGANLGRAACGGDVIVLSNPDVTFSANALDTLAAALDEKTAVAGPALYWDDAHEWILPPADLDTTAQKLDQVLATRAQSWFEQRDRRRIAKRLAFWSLQKTAPVPAVSGAVMAIRARDFDDADGFDERFPLYFEEIDFQRRIAERRRRIVYVPDARCRHMYNQSAGQDSSAAEAAFAQSELRYLEKWSGPFAARTLKRLEKPVRTWPVQYIDKPINIDDFVNVYVEASPLQSFTTAAGHFPRTSSVDLPRDVWEAARTDTIYLRTIERRTGRVLATYARNRT